MSCGCSSSPATRSRRTRPILELETDKATIEVPSSVAGVVKDVQVKAGQKIKVGQTILTVDGEASGPKEPKEKAAEAGAEGEPTAAEAGEAEASRRNPGSRGTGSRRTSPATAPRQKRGEVVDISRAPRTAPQAAPAPEVSAGGPPAGGPVGAPHRARAGRRHPAGERHRARRPHHGRRRAGLRAAGAGRRRWRQRGVARRSRRFPISRSWATSSASR